MNQEQKQVVCLKLNEILYFEYIKRSRKAAIILEDCRYECECTFENLWKNYNHMILR